MECRLVESALSHILFIVNKAGVGGYGVHLRGILLSASGHLGGNTVLSGQEWSGGGKIWSWCLCPLF